MAPLTVDLAAGRSISRGCGPADAARVSEPVARPWDGGLNSLVCGRLFSGRTTASFVVLFEGRVVSHAADLLAPSVFCAPTAITLFRTAGWVAIHPIPAAVAPASVTAAARRLKFAVRVPEVVA